MVPVVVPHLVHIPPRCAFLWNPTSFPSTRVRLSSAHTHVSHFAESIAVYRTILLHVPLGEKSCRTTLHEPPKAIASTISFYFERNNHYFGIKIGHPNL